MFVDAFFLVCVKLGSIRAFQVEGYAAGAGVAIVIVATAALDEAVLAVTREQSTGVAIAFTITWVYSTNE